MRASPVESGLARRARIVLLASEQRSNTEIASLVGVSRPTVLLWRGRYGAGGLAALRDLDRPGRPRTVSAEQVVVATLTRPPASLGVTHWSSRLLGKEFGISFATVARIWWDWDLQPWRIETFKFSTDPELDAKVRDVVGLYMQPRRRTPSSSASMRRPRSRRWTGPHRSCRCVLGSRRSRPTITSGTA